MSSETGSLLQKSLPHLLALDFSYVMMTPGDPHKWEFLTSFKRLERLTLDGTDVPSHVITNLGYVRKLSLKKMQHLGREVLDPLTQKFDKVYVEVSANPQTNKGMKLPVKRDPKGTLQLVTPPLEDKTLQVLVQKLNEKISSPHLKLTFNPVPESGMVQNPNPDRQQFQAVLLKN